MEGGAGPMPPRRRLRGGPDSAAAARVAGGGVHDRRRASGGQRGAVGTASAARVGAAATEQLHRGPAGAATREAWLDRAWEMKKSWHKRNGCTPDVDTPMVVTVGKQAGGSSSSCASSSLYHHSFASVAMDMEEVRACRDLGLELPPTAPLRFDITASPRAVVLPTATPVAASHGGA
uniref:Uncharacterized protein n=1 Tax=Aegilops tauschii subsp. strangulata TaxID=200361 RepID=A0A453CGU0_AEGTS